MVFLLSDLETHTQQCQASVSSGLAEKANAMKSVSCALVEVYNLALHFNTLFAEWDERMLVEPHL
jgi:hypothetical protein